jgi:hypothetical protein
MNGVLVAVYDIKPHRLTVVETLPARILLAARQQPSAPILRRARPLHKQLLTGRLGTSDRARQVRSHRYSAGRPARCGEASITTHPDELESPCQ